MIRVLFLIPQLITGGTEAHLYKLCKHLDKTRIFPLVVCSSEHGPQSRYANQLNSIGVEVQYLRFGTTRPADLVRLIRLINHSDIDIIHSFNYGDVRWDTSAFYLSRAKVLITERRNLQHWRTTRKVGIWEQMRNAITTCVVANSVAAKRVAIEIEDLEPSKILVIHNGVDLEQESGLHLGMPVQGIMAHLSRSFVIVNVATLKSVKRQEDIVRAVAVLRDCKKRPNVKLVLVGRSDQQYGDRVHRLVKELALDDQVIWLGEIEDPQQIYRMANVMVMSSDAEGFSNSILEAFANGVPVIATKVGGNLDVIVEGINGYLYKPRDVEDLVERLCQVQDTDDSSYNKLKHGARETASRFDIRVTAHKYEMLYQKHVDS